MRLWLVFSTTLSCTLGRTSEASTLARRYDNEEITVDDSRHDLDFFRFVTRPDLDAPRWQIEVYNESALAPGFWFVAPYGIVEQTRNDKAYVAPHIYDSHGQLVWSGAALFVRYNAFSFGASNVGGTDMLTALYPHGNHAVLLDQNYQVDAEVYIGLWEVDTNMHDFQIVNNGTHALYLTNQRKTTSLENSRTVGYEGYCKAEFNGFEERDIATGSVTFSWSSEGHIGLDESVTYTGRGNGGKCHGSKAWDYLHANSVEKLPDGDYLISGRRSYAIYKISHNDGSILWRLGGVKNDFEIKGHFSGQHDARCLFQNDTHMILSLMDNAKGPGPPTTTNPYSRGLILSVDTSTMTAEEVTEFAHPQNEYAFERGNVQVLPNSNVFCSWTDNTLISEYTADGTIIAQAHFPAGLKTYRAFKHPWIGRPRYPPDVQSELTHHAGEAFTIVHVSWNGATEVDRWSLYNSDAEGNATEFLTDAHRTGFETALMYGGHVPHVLVEGLDRVGNVLGRSRSIRSRVSTERTQPVVAEEVLWIDENIHALAFTPTWRDRIDSLSVNLRFLFLAGAAAGIVGVLLAWLTWHVWQRRLPSRFVRGRLSLKINRHEHRDSEERPLKLDEDWKED